MPAHAGIHVLTAYQRSKTWTAGTSPAMMPWQAQNVFAPFTVVSTPYSDVAAVMNK
jgi:hypothetical protein